jgi:hypothetical protein
MRWLSSDAQQQSVHYANADACVHLAERPDRKDALRVPQSGFLALVVTRGVLSGNRVLSGTECFSHDGIEEDRDVVAWCGRGMKQGDVDRRCCGLIARNSVVFHAKTGGQDS